MLHWFRHDERFASCFAKLIELVHHEHFNRHNCYQGILAQLIKSRWLVVGTRDLGSKTQLYLPVKKKPRNFVVWRFVVELLSIPELVIMLLFSFISSSTIGILLSF